MAIETILGGLLGGVTRLVPEVLSYLDKKQERKHELALGEQNLKVAQVNLEGQFRLKDREVEGAQFTSALEAMKVGIEAQGKPTGIKWVDAFSAIIRPAVTSWLFVLYAVYKSAALSLAMAAGVPLDQAIQAMWTPSDDAMLGAVLTFWFVGRVWERQVTRSFK